MELLYSPGIAFLEDMKGHETWDHDIAITLIENTLVFGQSFPAMPRVLKSFSQHVCGARSSAASENNERNYVRLCTMND